MNSKIFSLAATIVVGILIVLGGIFCWGAMQTEVDPETKQAVGDTISVDRSVNFAMFLAYASIILVLAFTVWGIIINPRRFIPSLIGVSVMLLIFFVAYGMASDKATGALTKLPMATPFWVKWSDIGVTMTYILCGLAVVLLVVQFFRNIFSYFSK